MQKAMLTFVKSTNSSRTHGRQKSSKSSPKSPQKQAAVQESFHNEKRVKKSKSHPVSSSDQVQIQRGMSRVRGRVSVTVKRDARDQPAAPIPFEGYRVPSPSSSFSVAAFSNGWDYEAESVEDRDDDWENTPPSQKRPRQQQQHHYEADLSPLPLPDSSTTVATFGTNRCTITPKEFLDGGGGGDSPEVSGTSGQRYQWTRPEAHCDGVEETEGVLALSSWLLPSDHVPARRSRNSRSTKTQNTDTPKKSRRAVTKGTKHTNAAWSTSASAAGRASTAKATTGFNDGDGASGLSTWLQAPKTQGRRTKDTTRIISVERVDDGESDGPLVHAGDPFHCDGDREEHDDGGNEDWISERFEGLDPSGAARAKDGWTDRERRNLTCTDVALGAKRKKSRKGGIARGWKTRADGSRVFVAPKRGGAAVVARGQTAFRIASTRQGR